jgi:hypothetical protein
MGYAYVPDETHLNHMTTQDAVSSRTGTGTNQWRWDEEEGGARWR